MLAIVDLDEGNAASVADELRGLGSTAISLPVDVRDPHESSRMVERVVAEFGRLDVMINNAGVVRVTEFLKVTPEDWDFTHSVNSRGLFFALQAGARQMVEQAPLVEGRPNGKIINMASIAARGGRPMFAAYAASKAAVVSITQSAAMALAPKVTVNAICPGVVNTAMWALIDQEWTELEGRPVGDAWKQRIVGIPMGRPETPEDLVGMAVFLASADSDYITGQSYQVDGGMVMT
jgi:meso-butanediol dehydrogenase/(S,S)-butanediol dehydrogenase/diacetyl reductase